MLNQEGQPALLNARRGFKKYLKSVFLVPSETPGE